jgi:hypothetical protein
MVYCVSASAAAQHIEVPSNIIDNHPDRNQFIAFFIIIVIRSEKILSISDTRVWVAGEVRKIPVILHNSLFIALIHIPFKGGVLIRIEQSDFPLILANLWDSS